MTLNFWGKAKCSTCAGVPAGYAYMYASRQFRMDSEYRHAACIKMYVWIIYLHGVNIVITQERSPYVLHLLPCNAFSSKVYGSSLAVML
jgi:hypothetical protein